MKLSHTILNLIEANLYTSYKSSRPMPDEDIMYIKRSMGTMKYPHGQAYSINQQASKTVIRVHNEVLKDPKVKNLFDKYSLSIDTELNQETGV